MKKKIVILLSLAIIICILLRTCGGNSAVKATIIDNDGTTVELSAKELCEIEESNEASFNNKYKLAEATIEGIVYSVDETQVVLELEGRIPAYKITLEGGWKVEVLQESHKEVIDLKSGDKVEIVSHIQSCFAGTVSMSNLTYSERQGWADNTVITVR